MTEETYEHVTVIKTLEDDPVNEASAGHIWFIEGQHPDGDDYRVRTDDGQVLGITTETVTVIQLSEALPEEEAVDTAHEQVKELVSLTERYEIEMDSTTDEDSE